MCNFQALDDVVEQDMCDHGALRIFTYYVRPYGSAAAS